MTDMTDDAIEWLNEIRCWINRCKDTEWGEDDQTIVDFITAALSAPRVPVIDGLDEAIEKFKHFVLTGESGGAAMTYPIEKAISAYAELQKGN